MSKKLGWLCFIAVLSLPVLVIWLSATSPSNTASGGIVDTGPWFEESEHSIELVFFGFVGCQSVCPSALTRMSEALRIIQSDPDLPSTGALFADINYQREYDMAEAYLAGFIRTGTPIRGLNLTEIEVHQAAAAFNLTIIPAGITSADIDHTDHIFVLRKSGDVWIIDRILPTNTSTKLIVEAVRASASHMSIKM